MIARSTLWGTIQIGDDFYLLTEQEQCAVLSHEQGHIYHRHAWKRLARLLTFRWNGFYAMCEAQEREADRYAAERGHAAGLISFLLRSPLDAKSDGYPTHRQRIGAIHVR
jgi:Zn-dependent protease with chaperone function